MRLNEYQELAAETDQNPRAELTAMCSAEHEPTRAEVIPLLGMVGEVGSLLSEYKKLLRDGQIHRRFKDEVAEELGDVLWYVADVATKYGLSLQDIASQNLKKVEGRWKDRAPRATLYDDDQAPESQLPRNFEYSFEHRVKDGVDRLVLVDLLDPEQRVLGDPLTDNSYNDDGYRYHDVFHLALAAMLGWSPVYRKLLRKCEHVKLANRAPTVKDDTEDGGRAQIIEEAITLTAYGYAAAHDMFANATAIDWQLLRSITKMTAEVEVKDRSTKEWNDTILRAFEIWRQLRENHGGIVRGDLRARTIEFSPPRAGLD